MVDHFHEIPNSHKHAFFVDYETTKKDSDKLQKFITAFNPNNIEANIRVISLIDNFP